MKERTSRFLSIFFTAVSCAVLSTLLGFGQDFPSAREVDTTREVYLPTNSFPRIYTETEPADFKNLTVTYLPKNDQRFYHMLEVPFPKAWPDLDLEIQAFGFATNGPQGSVVERFYRPETGKLKTRISPKVEACSIIFGEAILRSRTGNRQITVTKTGDQAQVPFEVEGQAGSVTFDDNNARITDFPTGVRCAIYTYHNADGRALMRSLDGRSCMGKPSSVRIQVATGVEIRRVPFEIELGGDYDKAAYATYKKNVRPIKASAEPVPTTKPGTLIDLSEPYDAQALAKQLGESMPQQIWCYGIREDRGKQRANFSYNRLPDAPSLAKHVTISFEPLSAVNSNGVDILNKSDTKRQHPFTSARTGNFTIPLVSDHGTPSKGSGRITLAVPRQVEYLTFPAKVDQTFLLGFTELTVTHVVNDVVQLNLTYGGRFAEIQALDQKGQALTVAKRDGDPKPSNDWTTRALRFNGTIHELHVRVASNARRRFPFEFETDFKKLTKEEAAAETRERYRYVPPTRAPIIDQAFLDKLVVTWTAPDPKKRNTPSLNTPFPIPAPSHRVSYSLYGFGKDGPTSIGEISRVRGTNRIHYRSFQKPGVVFGYATVSGPANVRYLELEKVADGEPVAFTVNDLDGSPQSGELVFDKNTVKITKAPERGTVKLHLLENAKGQALDSHEGEAWGIPNKATLYTSSGTGTHIIPFQFELGEYDKAGLATYKEQLNVMSAFKQLRQGSGYQTPIDTLAGLYYMHDSNGKPLHRIPEELAHADPYGAKLFGYEAKPYLGYYFVTCTAFANKDRPPMYPGTRESDMMWDGGTLKLKRAKLRYFNAIPVDRSKHTLHTDGVRTFAKKLAAQPEAIHYRLGPNTRDKEQGWQNLGHVK